MIEIKFTGETLEEVQALASQFAGAEPPVTYQGPNGLTTGPLAPIVSRPAVDAPAVDAPAVDAPAVDVPAVDVPAVDVPAVDAKGLPWDERIHAPAKTLNKDGTWRYKRNVPDDLKDAVENELSEATPTPTPPTPTPPTPTPPTPTPPTPTPPTPTPPTPTPPTPPTPTPTPPTPTAADDAPQTFVQLIQRVERDIDAGHYTAATTAAVAVEKGLEGISGLFKSGADEIADFHAALMGRGVM